MSDSEKEKKITSIWQLFKKILNLNHSMTGSEMTQHPEEMENVHMILDDDDWIKMVTGKVVEEL